MKNTTKIDELEKVHQAIRNRNCKIEGLLKGVYVNNPFNRMLNRVGQTYGKDVSQIIKVYSKKETIDIHTDNDGKFIKARIKVHDKIINDMFGSSKPNRKHPVATLLVGGPGSGKSYIYQSFFKQQVADSVYINADDVKEALPEFSKYKQIDVKSASVKVHEESSHISKIAIIKAIEEGHNLILDAVMGNADKAKKVVDDLKAHGYKINVIGVMVDADKAAYSAIKRGHSKKRYVPMSIVKAGNAGARNTLKHILKRGVVDSISLFDNNGLNKKLPPQIIIKDNVIKNTALLAGFMKSK